MIYLSAPTKRKYFMINKYALDLRGLTKRPALPRKAYHQLLLAVLYTSPL